jgi:hypothetical protein
MRIRRLTQAPNISQQAGHSQPMRVATSSPTLREVTRPTIGNRLVQAKHPEGADAVGWQVHAGPDILPAGLPLDQLRGEPSLAQRSGKGQAGQPSPDDEDPGAFHIVPLPRTVITRTLSSMSQRCAPGD